MAVGYLNERTQKIITMILKGSSELTIKEIAAELSVSVRTVYNELDKADGWLAMKKLPLLRVIRGRVQPFLEEEKLALESALALETPKEDYIFTPGERVRIIVCQIMASEPPGLCGRSDEYLYGEQKYNFYRSAGSDHFASRLSAGNWL